MSDTNISYSYRDDLKCPVDGCKEVSCIGHDNKKVDKEPAKFKPVILLKCKIHKKAFILNKRIPIKTTVTVEENYK